MFIDTEQKTGGSLSIEQHTVSLAFFLDVAKIVVCSSKYGFFLIMNVGASL
jgi:hypothetical protein